MNSCCRCAWKSLRVSTFSVCKQTCREVDKLHVWWPRNLRLKLDVNILLSATAICWRTMLLMWYGVIVFEVTRRCWRFCIFRPSRDLPARHAMVSHVLCGLCREITLDSINKYCISFCGIKWRLQNVAIAMHCHLVEDRPTSHRSLWPLITRP